MTGEPTEIVKRELRIPEDLDAEVLAESRANRRSKNAEVLTLIREALDARKAARAKRKR